MFVLRSAFWLTILVMLLPADPVTGAAPRLTIVDAVTAARETIADLSGFCQRNRDVCVTSGAAIQLVAERAENGVEMIYEFLDGPSEPQDRAAGEVRRGTLTTDDLALPWHGGKPDGSV
jgi:Family of unknown function (DUF5330)